MSVMNPHRPNPATNYNCPYCNEGARLRDEGVVVDAYTNVCHEDCLPSAECEVSSFSARVCERGTKGCDTHHSSSPPPEPTNTKSRRSR